MLSKLLITLCASILLIALSIPLLLKSPTSNYKDIEDKLFKTYSEKQTARNEEKKNNVKRNPLLSVMSFNVRLDAQEHDVDNHFTRRVFRLADTIQKWQPAIAGLQEPFGGQVEHLLSVLNLKTEKEVEEKRKRDLPTSNEKNVHHQNNKTTNNTSSRSFYKALGYNRPGIDPEHRTHPARHGDFFAAILYRPDLLDLIEQDFIWLTDTPREDGSRQQKRVANIARFKTKTGAKEEEKDVIIFNTHLCVRWEHGRRQQSAILVNEVAKWKKRFPRANIFVTGDFNSAPGSFTHRTLLGEEGYFEFPSKSTSSSSSLVSTSEERSNLLADTWETLQNDNNNQDSTSSTSLVMNDVALTFNGWLGVTLVDSYLARILGRFGFMLHAMQFKIPISPLTSFREVVRAARDFISSVPEYSILESLPKNWMRNHVDYIYHDKETAVPKMFVIADARDEKLSSDHFPIVGLFELK